MRHGDVCPPIPGRYTDALADFVDAIDGAALVAASYHEFSVHHINDKRLPTALHLVNIQLLLHDELVDDTTFAYGANDDTTFSCGSAVADFAGCTTDLAHIVGQVVGSTDDTLPVLTVHDNRCRLAVFDNTKRLVLCYGVNRHDDQYDA